MSHGAPKSNDQRVKNWNRLLTSPAPFQVERIKIIESDLFASQVIDLPRVLALIGLHGSGKSLMLRTLEAAFGYTYEGHIGPPFFRGDYLYPGEVTPVTGTLEVTIKTPSGPLSRIVDLSKPAGQRRQLWIDDLGDYFPAYYMGPLPAFTDLSYVLQEYADALRHVDEYVLRQLTAAELRMTRQVLGRQYDSVNIYSIDAGGNSYFPYFSAQYMSKTMDASVMSNGELWVHYADWFLQDLMPAKSLALVDEPETFLSAQGRRPFIDKIASHVLSQQMQLIIGTHSPEVLARFPLDNIRMCVTTSSGIQVIEPESIGHIRDTMGIDIPVRALVLVEDNFAKQVLSCIFAQYDVALMQETEIIPAGGATQVLNGLRIIQHASRLASYGVLDGDQRGRIPAKSDSIKELIYHLPGDGSPEEELLASAEREALWLSKSMGRTTKDIFVAINAGRNLDHQYRIPSLASHFGQAESTLVFLLVRAWLRGSSVRRQADKLIRDLRESILTQGRGS